MKKRQTVTCSQQQYPPNPWRCCPQHPVTFSPRETQTCPCVCTYYFKRVQARPAEFCSPSPPLQSRTADWLQSGDRQSHIPGIRLMLFGHLTESVPLLLAEGQFLDTTPSRQQLVVLPTPVVLCNESEEFHSFIFKRNNNGKTALKCSAPKQTNHIQPV